MPSMVMIPIFTRRKSRWPMIKEELMANGPTMLRTMLSGINI